MIHKKIIKNGRKLSGLWKNRKVQRGDGVGLTEQVTSEQRLEGRRGGGHVDQREEHIGDTIMGRRALGQERAWGVRETARRRVRLEQKGRRRGKEMTSDRLGDMIT